jgi:predicted lipid-binding transport protein (Tim44 family)
MLVSISSFAPIIIVGPISDLFGNTAVLFLVAMLVFATGVLSVVRRGRRLKPEESREKARGPERPAGLDPVSVSLAADLEVGHRRTPRPGASAAAQPVQPDASTPAPADGPGAAADTPLEDDPDAEPAGHPS